MKFNPGALGGTLAVVAAFVGLLCFKRNLMLHPEVLMLMNLLSLAIFLAYMYEAPEYDDQSPFHGLKYISNRTTGLATVLMLVAFYLYNQHELIKKMTHPTG